MLQDHLADYRKIENFIAENQVQELASFLTGLTQDNRYKLGPRTFSPYGLDPPSPYPPCDPNGYCTRMNELTMHSILMIACQHPYQSPDTVAFLLSRKFRKLISPNKCEWYYHHLHSWSCVAPLHVACTGYSQNLALVKTLVKLGADVNLKTLCCGETPLHLAVASYGTDEAVDIVRFLISRGAKVNAVDACGNTPLSLLLHRGDKAKREELGRVLLSKRLKVNRLNNVGFGPLHYASLSNEAWAVKKLLSKGASPMFNVSDDRKYSPTSPLFLTSSEEVVRIFASRFSCPLSCKIDGLLLVGCSVEGRQEEGVFKKVWKEAIALREAHGIIPNDEHSLGDCKEIATLQEVEQFTDRKYGTPPHEQLLLIQERCIGYVGDLSILKEISYINSAYFNVESIRTHFFKRMIHCFKNTSFPHWTLSIEMHWKQELSCFSGCVNTAVRHVCTPYFNQNVPVQNSESLEQFAGLCIDLLEALQYNYNHMLCTKYIFITKGLEEFIWSLLYIFVRWYCIIYQLGLVSEPSAMQPLKNSIQKLVDTNMNFLGTTLLHFIPRIFTRTRHVMDIYELILQCDGVEPYVNLVSTDIIRPIHCVAFCIYHHQSSKSSWSYDYSEDHENDNLVIDRMVSIILSLIENGAHIDAVNGHGQTLWDYTIEVHEPLPPHPRALACLASHVIVREIPYRQLSSVPPRLKHFIDLHNPDACRDESDCVAM